MKRLLAGIVTCCCLLTVQSANAKGCLEGAVLGGAVGHMSHHTFLGIFGGCAGGLYVHHLYTKWHREHPNGNLNQFADDYHGWLPAGWDERLRTAGDASPRPGTTKPITPAVISNQPASFGSCLTRTGVSASSCAGSEVGAAVPEEALFICPFWSPRARCRAPTTDPEPAGHPRTRRHRAASPVPS